MSPQVSMPIPENADPVDAPPFAILHGRLASWGKPPRQFSCGGRLAWPANLTAGRREPLAIWNWIPAI
jgi:hypothetical protein